MSRSIQQVVDNYIASMQEDRKYSGKIGASCLGQCLRRTYFGIKREPKSNPISKETLRIFECGNIFHDFIQSKLDNYKIEQPYSDDTVSIRVDGVNDEEVLEIKSMHSRGFWHLKKELETKTISEIKPQHVLQACCGAKYFNRKFARLVYVSKDDLYIAEFRITVRPCDIERVEEEISLIKSSISCDLLPPAQPRLYVKNGKSGECKYCNWRDLCKTKETTSSNT